MESTPPRSERVPIYRHLKELIRPRLGLFAVGLLVILINRGAGLVTPASTRYLLDEIVAKRRLEMLPSLAAIVAAAILVQALTSYALIPLLSLPAQRLVADLRSRIQQHIGRLPVSYYDANKTGVLVSRAMHDVEGVVNLIGTGLVEFLGGILTAIGAGILLFGINSYLTFLCLILLAAFGTVVSLLMRKLRPMYRNLGAIRAEVTGRLTESFGGTRIVKGFHAEERESKVFAAGVTRIYDQLRRTMLRQASLSAASAMMMGAIVLLVMVVGGRFMVAGDMSVGDFVQFTLLMGFVMSPVFGVVRIGGQISEAFAGLDRMHEVLSERPEDDDPSRTRRLSGIEGRIRFDDVFFEYEEGKPVLRGVSFDSPPGSVTALVGPSGSGKSTVIGLVAAFMKPTEGVVSADGIDLSTVVLDSYRSRLGVVLQDNFLFDGTIRENILFGRPGAGDDEILHAARIARVDEFAERFDKKYETVIGERGVKLSGGQRQRVAIARAILAAPRILILDEATSSLDTESEFYIQEGLAALMRGRTTFVIAHRLSTIRRADQILVLENGLVVERGVHEELLEARGRYFDLYTRQADLQANRFLNPGEKPPIEEPAATRAPDSTGSQDGVTTRDLLGL